MLWNDQTVLFARVSRVSGVPKPYWLTRQELRENKTNRRGEKFVDDSGEQFLFFRCLKERGEGGLEELSGVGAQSGWEDGDDD